MKKTILFFILLFFLMAGSSAVFSAVGKGLENRVRDRNQTAAGIQTEKPDTVDVVVLGDSESYTSISPLGLWLDKGITSYICGQSGQRIVEGYYMLKNALKTQSPKLVILETDTVFQYSSLIAEMQTALSEAGNYYFPVFRYHNLWKVALNGAKKPHRFDRKGFLIRSSVHPYRGGEYMKKTEEREKIKKLVWFYLEALQKLCRKQGISLLFVTVPSPKHHTYQKHNALMEYTQQRGIPYLDLNLKLEEVGIDWEKDSLDNGDHLNFSGAKKVTKYMAEYLDEHYDLEDHRQDEAYKQWNTDAQKYKKILEK